VDQRPSEVSEWTHQADHLQLTDDLRLYAFSHDYNNIIALLGHTAATASNSGYY